MGFIDTAPESGLPIFFNVVHAVGKQCPNIRDDVKLVQYLLIVAFDPSLGGTRPSGKLSVNGICDTTTINWIHRFQLDMHSIRPGSILVDDRVDRVRNRTTLTGSMSKTLYTLGLLNAVAAISNPTAFAAAPQFVPLENAATVPGPTPDVVRDYGKPLPVPSTGGF